MNIADNVEQSLNAFFAWLPNLIGAIVILVVGWIIAVVVAKLVRKLCRSVGLDRQLDKGRAGEWISRVVSSPTALVGTFAFWLVMLGAISLAVTALGIDALTAFVAAVYAYLPHVLAAALIFLVAAALSGAVSAFVGKVMGDTPTGKVVATAAPILIMTIASFMILTELMIAQEIVLITYAGLIGAIALGSALAFGLGGREVASRALDTAVEKGKEQQDQVKRDVDKGRSSTKRFVRDAKDSSSDVGVGAGAGAGSTGGSTSVGDGTGSVTP